jgi:hypothetical protein
MITIIIIIIMIMKLNSSNKVLLTMESLILILVDGGKGHFARGRQGDSA